MILHASFAVDNPAATAMTIAQLMGGEALPYPDLGDRAWIAMAGDADGTLVELLERGTEFHYIAGRAVAHRQGAKTRESGCHILIETPLDEQAVLALAAESGARAQAVWHGPLRVIEFWIDDCFLLEVATAPIAAAYRAMATPANARAMALEMSARSATSPGQGLFPVAHDEAAARAAVWDAWAVPAKGQTGSVAPSAAEV